MDGLAARKNVVIDGVAVKELLVHPDDRGRLYEILRADDSLFTKFGQVYITTAFPGVVKAWHYHKIQTDYFCCIEGSARLVLYDPRGDSSTRGAVMEFDLRPDNPRLVMIPPHVYHGFQCLSKTEAIMLNIPTESYNAEHPDEYRLDPHDPTVPYVWR